MRLYGSPVRTDGFLQLRCDPEDEWKTVKVGSDWSRDEGQVVCKHLGFNAHVDTQLVRQSPKIASFEVTEVSLHCKGHDVTNLLECVDTHVLKEPLGFAWVSCGFGKR